MVSDPKPATKDSSKIAATDCLSKTSSQKLIFVCGCAIICSGTAFFSTQSIQGIVESLDKGLDGHNPAQKIYDRALAPSYVEHAIWLSASLSFLALLCLGYGLQKQSESRTRGLTKLLLNLKDRSQLASVGNDDNCKSPETNDKNFSDKCGSDKALAEAFNSLATSLKDLDSGHRQWVADTSHELRTPIAVLRAQVEAFQDGVHEITPRNLEVLHNEIMALSKLVDDLHWLAKYDVGQIRSQASALDINQTLQDVLESFEERREAKEIALDNQVPTEEKLIIDGDSSRIRQVITNLVENSLRYTNKGGTLRISHNRSGKRLRIIFEDTEPGVPDELLPKLFDRFFRVESSRSRTMGGSGLGLAICLNNMQMLGGTIEASRSAMGGLKIELSLPAGDKTDAKGSKTNLKAIEGKIDDKIDNKEEGAQ